MDAKGLLLALSALSSGGVLDWGGFNRTPFCMNFLGCLSGADPEAPGCNLATPACLREPAQTSLKVLLAHEEGIIRCFRDEPPGPMAIEPEPSLKIDFASTSLLF